MSIQDELLSSIETMIQNTVANYMPQSDYACVVKAIANGKYEVSINGGTYHVYNGVGINVKVGSAVWVHVPNQNFGQAFIIGSRGYNALVGTATTATVTTT